MVNDNRRATNIGIFIAACGLIAGLALYLNSFFGGTLRSNLVAIAALGGGAIATGLMMFYLAYPVSKRRTFLARDFADAMPGWVLPLTRFLWFLVLLHLAWLFIQGRGGVAVVRDGQYALASRSQILRLIIAKQYWALKSAELRGLASIFLVLYTTPLLYFWFRRQKNEVG